MYKKKREVIMVRICILASQIVAPEVTRAFKNSLFPTSKKDYNPRNSHPYI
jgi:hypothetical protein